MDSTSPSDREDHPKQKASRYLFSRLGDPAFQIPASILMRQSDQQIQIVLPWAYRRVEKILFCGLGIGGAG